MSANKESNPITPLPSTPPRPGQPSRPAFWVDTCRELTEVHDRSPLVVELHRQYGCRFIAPTIAQAESILVALDAAMPGWDRQHPELFYQALELNFPELTRRLRVPA